MPRDGLRLSSEMVKLDAPMPRLLFPHPAPVSKRRSSSLLPHLLPTQGRSKLGWGTHRSLLRYLDGPRPAPVYWCEIAITLIEAFGAPRGESRG